MYIHTLYFSQKNSIRKIISFQGKFLPNLECSMKRTVSEYDYLQIRSYLSLSWYFVGSGTSLRGDPSAARISSKIPRAINENNYDIPVVSDTELNLTQLFQPNCSKNQFHYFVISPLNQYITPIQFKHIIYCFKFPYKRT